MTDFKPMLAHSKSPDPASLSYPLIAQPKLDGIRAAVVNGRLLSRTLKPIPNAEIQAALARPEFEGLDGELIVGSPAAPDCYRTTSSYVMAPGKTGGDWTYHVFDVWDSPLPCAMRMSVLAGLAVLHQENSRLAFVPCEHIADEAALEAYEAKLLAEGHEGVIVRLLHAPYKFGRSGKTGPLLKLKRYIDFEAEVIGVYEEQHNANEAKTNALGRTERSTAKAGKIGKGTLGGLILRAINGPAEGVEFRCGTGFTAAMRESMWAERDSLIGTLAKIKSFPIGVKDKPRHPVYVGVRSTIDLVDVRA